MCLPTGLDESDMQRLDGIMVRRRVPKDGILYSMGESFRSLYAIRVGHFKTYQLACNGQEHISAFQMTGDLLGMDAISTDQHHCYAVALEDSEVCEIPFTRLQGLFSDIPPLLRHFHRTMSQEIMREQSAMFLLGNMSAEQRFSAFLVNLSLRYKARGYSSTNYQLRMSREDIGKYLGLTIESVSRLLSKFRAISWISVDRREVTLLDLPALKLHAMQNTEEH